MRCKVLTFFAIAPFLIACNSSVPARGYEKWKKDIKQHYSGQYTYTSCSYAYLKNYPNEPSLNETCFYYSTFSINGTGMYSYYAYKSSNDYLEYDMEASHPGYPTGYMYNAVVKIIQNNPNYGTFGNL